MNENKFNGETKEIALKNYRETISLFFVGLGSLFSVSLVGISMIIVIATLTPKTQSDETNRLFPFIYATVIYLLFYSTITTKTKYGSNAYKLLQILKRFIDLVITSSGLFILMPLLIVIIIVIKASSAGPIFSHSKRVGQFGKSISVYRFRTRYLGIAEMQLTPVGKFLRRFSLDELPMLYGVLEGELSLVGPYPRSYDEDYRSVENYKKILSVKPGITGLAVVSGASSDQEAINLDLEYIDNWSVLLDFKILFKTTSIVLRNE